MEAKSHVQQGTVKQLQRACDLWMRVHGGQVTGFIGGPLFDQGVKNMAFEQGFLVVEVSGDKYRVVEKDSTES